MSAAYQVVPDGIRIVCTVCQVAEVIADGGSATTLAEAILEFISEHADCNGR